MVCVCLCVWCVCFVCVWGEEVANDRSCAVRPVPFGQPLAQYRESYHSCSYTVSITGGIGRCSMRKKRMLLAELPQPPLTATPDEEGWPDRRLCHKLPCTHCSCTGPGSHLICCYGRVVLMFVVYVVFHGDMAHSLLACRPIRPPTCRMWFVLLFRVIITYSGFLG